ncbi:unnamed protein product, partial [Musa textilis]
FVFSTGKFSVRYGSTRDCGGKGANVLTQASIKLTVKFILSLQKPPKWLAYSVYGLVVESLNLVI